MKEVILFGNHTIQALINNNPQRIKKIFLCRTKDNNQIINLSQEKKINLELVDRGFLENKLNLGKEAQGIAALCSPFYYYSLPDLLNLKPKKLLILDCWQDAQNIGRAARSALCFGIDAIILCADRSASITPQAEKTSVGALSQLVVARVKNLAQSVQELKKHNFFIYGADLAGSTNLAAVDFAPQSAIIIGQEESGLRELTKKRCDLLVKIPMAQHDLCLNAADSALIFLYELCRN